MFELSRRLYLDVSDVLSAVFGFKRSANVLIGSFSIFQFVSCLRKLSLDLHNL